MDIRQKLSFFLDLVCCNYEMFLWSYDADFHLTDTTSTYRDVMTTIGFEKTLQAHIASGKHTPLILETRIGLVWIAGFEYADGSLKGIHLIGSSFTGTETPVILLKKMGNHDLSVKLRATITKMITDMPVLPTNVLSNYAVMLHYTLNQEKISITDIAYSLPDDNRHFDSLNMLPDEHNGIWMNEQKLCKMFEEGDPNYERAIAESFSISCGMKMDVSDALRKHKNNALVLLTLCSRSCLKGGLNPAVAYSLNDYYATMLEQCRTLGEVSKVCGDLTKDYVTRLQKAKQSSAVSSRILDACYYIKHHLTEPLSIADLAKRIGYTEYYFSHKFKKETGCSVHEYILNEKIEQAKLLLTGTNQSIQDISDSLAFSNRSYFYSCFQKKTGCSPSEYRKQHGTR